MKNRKLKGLLGAFLALGMALSVGTALSFAKPHQPAEIVLAEDAEQPTSSEEAPAKEESQAPAQQSSQESAKQSSRSSTASSLKAKAKKAIKLILTKLKNKFRSILNKFRQKANI